MITVLSNNGNGINFPTNVNEITGSDLESINERYNVNKYFAVVAICQRIKLFDLVTSINTKKVHECPVTCLLAKVNKEEFKLGEPGDICIIERSDIERGYHLNNPTSISVQSVTNFFNNNPDLRKSFINGKGEGEYTNSAYPFKTIRNSEIYLVEFKIIPIQSIVACRKVNSTAVNPYHYNNDLPNDSNE